MTTMNKALKKQEEEKKLANMEGQLKLANLIVDASEHEGIKKLVEILNHYVTIFNEELRKQYHYVVKDGQQVKERYTIREIDQMVVQRDAYEDVLRVFDTAKMQKEHLETKIEKIEKK